MSETQSKPPLAKRLSQTKLTFSTCASKNTTRSEPDCLDTTS